MKPILVGCLLWLGVGEIASADDYDFSGGCRLEDERAITAEGGCKEVQTGLVWGPRATQPGTYEEAVRYCAGFRNGRWGGWQLPRLKDTARVAKLGFARENLEPRSLFDFFWVRGHGNETFKTVSALVSDDSADRSAAETAGIFCVRQGVEGKLGCRERETDYFLTADGGCLYKKTGLIFSQPSPSPMSVADAERRCDDLVEGGQSDWRLPKLEELRSVAWAGGADAHFKFKATGDFWSVSRKETNHTHREPAGMGSVLVKESTVFVLWVNLLTGVVGEARSTHLAVPYGGHEAIYSRGPWDAYRANERFDLSNVKGSVLCVRP